MCSHCFLTYEILRISFHLRTFVQSNVTCSCHDIAEKLLFGIKQQILNHSCKILIILFFLFSVTRRSRYTTPTVD